MSDQSTLECSLADVLTPPTDAALEWMLIATHDFTSTAFVDHVLSLAIGDSSGDAQRRRAMAFGEFHEIGAKIAIFACDRAINQGYALHSNIHVVAVAGRRLHAKCALLKFKPKAKGESAVYRAVVTSANLTDSGLGKNREVLVCAERRRRTKTPSLVTDVAEFFRSLSAYAEGSAGMTECATLVAHALREVGPSVGLSGDFVHSIGGDGILEQIRVSSSKPVARLVVVSPPFASKHAGIEAAVIRKLCRGASPSIELYTGDDAAARGVAFSRSALEALLEVGSKLSIRSVPTLVPNDTDDAPPTVRKLHAKLIALEDKDGAVDVWSGSANYTRNGLLPSGNIEAMVRVRVTRQDLDAFLAHLEAREVDFANVTDSGVNEFDDGDSVPLPVRAIFRPFAGENVGRARVKGELRVEWDGSGPPEACAFYYPEKANALPTLTFDTPLPRFTFILEKGALYVERGGSTSMIRIEMEADEAFWTPDALEEPVELGDREWEALLAALERGRAPQVTPAGAETTGKSASANIDDVFRLPLEQRVAMFARHRERLARAEELDDCPGDLSHLFPDKPIAASVARVFLADATNSAYDPKDDLLKALQKALPGFTAVSREAAP